MQASAQSTGKEALGSSVAPTLTSQEVRLLQPPKRSAETSSVVRRASVWICYCLHLPGLRALPLAQNHRKHTTYFPTSGRSRRLEGLVPYREVGKTSICNRSLYCKEL